MVQVGTDTGHFTSVGLTSDAFYDDYDIPPPGIRQYYEIVALAVGRSSMCYTGESGDPDGDSGDSGYVD